MKEEMTITIFVTKINKYIFNYLVGFNNKTIKNKYKIVQSSTGYQISHFLWNSKYYEQNYILFLRNQKHFPFYWEASVAKAFFNFIFSKRYCISRQTLFQLEDVLNFLFIFNYSIYFDLLIFKKFWSFCELLYLIFIHLWIHNFSLLGKYIEINESYFFNIQKVLYLHM